MFKPSSPTLNAGFTKYLEGAVADKSLSSGEWLTKFKAGVLPLDDALALKVHIDEARRIKA